MARANVYKETAEVKKKSHKRLLAILIPSAVVVIAAVIVLILWGVGVFNNDNVETQLTKYDTYKINYSQLSNELAENENTFLFVYDNDTYASLSDSQKNSIEMRIERLINTIKQANEEDEANRFSIYLIDTTVSSNSSILENADYGNVTFTPQLMYIYDGTYYASMQDACDAEDNLNSQVQESDKDIVFTNSSVEGLINNLNEANQLVSNM